MKISNVQINFKFVKYFKEKSKLDESWINGGFFVIEPKFLKLIKNDNTFLEREPMESVTKKNHSPEEFDLRSFDLRRGDALCFHPGCLLELF